MIYQNVSDLWATVKKKKKVIEIENIFYASNTVEVTLSL